MAEFSMQSVAPTLMITGAISSAAGAYYSAKSQSYAIKSQNLARDFESATRKNQLLSKAYDLELEAYLAELNAKTMINNAEQILRAGNIKASQLMQKVGVLKSKQRAGYAARGIDMGSQTVAEMSYSADMMKDIDSNMILENAMYAHFGEMTKAANMETQSMLTRTAAQNYKNTPVNASHMVDTSNPIGSMFSSLLGSAGQVATSWYLSK